MTNPISANARAKIYVLGIIVGALATVAPTILAALQVPPSWTTVAVSTIGLITTISSILARGNLTPDDVSAVEHGVSAVAADVKVAKEGSTVAASTPDAASVGASSSAPVVTTPMSLADLAAAQVAAAQPAPATATAVTPTAVA